MCVEGKDGVEGGIVDGFDASIARGHKEVRAGPVEDALVGLDRLLVLGSNAQGGAIDGDEEVILKG